jgi:hypothetical protein
MSALRKRPEVRFRALLSAGRCRAVRIGESLALPLHYFLESDAEHLLEAYEKRCVEALADLSPEERREVYKLLDLTVEAHPDGRLEAAWALNASVSKIRARSRRSYVLCR